MLTTTRVLVVLAFVSLASRSSAATVTVLNANDSGAGSLRQALQDAKNLEGAVRPALDPAAGGSAGATSNFYEVCQQLPTCLS